MATTTTETPQDFVLDLKTQLEQQYIRLLEQRIQDLERLVTKNKIDNDDKVNEGNNDDTAGGVSDVAEGKHEREKCEAPGNEAPGDEASGNEGLGNEQDVTGEGKPVQNDPIQPSRIRRVVVKNGQEEALVSSTKLEEKKNEQFIATFREVKGNEKYCEIDILESSLREILKSTIGEYPGQSWEGEMVNVREPFRPMIHHWQALQAAAAINKDDDTELAETKQDLRGLMELIESSPGLKDYFKTRQSHLSAKIISCDTLWTLFVPNQQIYASLFMRAPQLFTVVDCWVNDPEADDWLVDCWCYDWNGKEIVKVYYSIKIQKFQGTKKICDLTCFPLKYFEGDSSYQNSEQLTHHLIDRGAKYNRIARARVGSSQMFEYLGDAFSNNRSTFGKYNDDENAIFALSQRKLGDRPSWARASMTGKCIIDAGAFLEFNGGLFYLGDMSQYMVEDKDMSELTTLTKEASSKGISTKFEDRTEKERIFLSLLPPRLLGYSTRSKSWAQFNVAHVKDASPPQADAFTRTLQLNKVYKDMISAMVKAHESTSIDTKNDTEDKKKVTDIVAGKGQGLVILLHGPPGVGKTLTAETIAEATGKPLFTVSVAEIGLNAAKAERNLERMFLLAGKWEAILLVDEADVFLDNRTSESTSERNALVSVLLRVLEYYQGIMILTTNRVTTIDVAVQSRIHLAVRYDDLKKEQKMNIFRYYLDQLEKSNIGNREAIDNWIDEAGAEVELNGRQIRNVVSAALALARDVDSEGRKGDGRVQKGHLKRVMQVTKDFANDMAETTRDIRAGNEAGRKK